jgi:cytochrome c oxidase subunit II
MSAEREVLCAERASAPAPASWATAEHCMSHRVAIVGDAAKSSLLGRAVHFALRAACSALLLSLAGCSGPQRVLAPKSPYAERIVESWWIMFGLAAAICVLVIVLLFWAVLRSRQRERGEQVSEVDGIKLVVGGGVVLPAVIISGLLVYSLPLGDYVRRPLGGTAEQALTVDVIGHMFWWEVRYPELGISTANEVWIPTGRPVRVRLASRDVIHSFWVPELQGKTDMLPGRVNELWLKASEPGAFRGQCAEYCGHGHALMAFWVTALPPDEFDAWAEQRRTPRPEPGNGRIAAGREVFFQAGCGECHATRGAALPRGIGVPGPDLSDLAARRTLAAGTLANNRGNLAAWILEPQRIKPHNRMPPTHLEGEALQALLDYLMSLR